VSFGSREVSDSVGTEREESARSGATERYDVQRTVGRPRFTRDPKILAVAGDRFSALAIWSKVARIALDGYIIPRIY